MLFNLNKLLMLWVTEYIFTDPVLKEIVEKTGLSINSIKNKTPKYLKLVLCNQWGSMVPNPINMIMPIQNYYNLESDSKMVDCTHYELTTDIVDLNVHKAKFGNIILKDKFNKTIGQQLNFIDSLLLNKFVNDLNEIITKNLVSNFIEDNDIKENIIDDIKIPETTPKEKIPKKMKIKINKPVHYDEIVILETSDSSLTEDKSIIIESKPPKDKKNKVLMSTYDDTKFSKKTAKIISFV
tara:strand:+ start:429 stop:1145 length:717 start_codon:yes stop_codon:yes gene_type:complete